MEDLRRISRVHAEAGHHQEGAGVRERYQNAVQLDFEASKAYQGSASPVQFQLQPFHCYLPGSGDGEEKLPGLNFFFKILFR